MFLLLRPDIFPKRLGVTVFESSGQNHENGLYLQSNSVCTVVTVFIAHLSRVTQLAEIDRLTAL